MCPMRVKGVMDPALDVCRQGRRELEAAFHAQGDSHRRTSVVSTN